MGCLVAAASRWWSLVDGVMAAGLGAEGPLRDRVSFRWWISFLRQGQRGYWGSHLTTPQVRLCSLRDTAHPSPGPPPPITLMPHPPLHYQPCPLESLKDPIFRGSLGGPPQHTHTLTGGSRAAPGCICHHPAWRRCAQPQWPGQWLGGHPAPGPVGGQEWALRPGGQVRVQRPEPALEEA